MIHTDIINALIKKGGYQKYLEIGIDNPNNNYLQINAPEKECVDPYIKGDGDFKDSHEILSDEEREYIIENIITYRMTSDEFFETIPKDKKYDIVFIDGLHTEEQVGRDIINTFKHLNKGGIIVVHDCLPANETAQIVPRISDEWNGTVWKAIPMLSSQGINYSVVDCDYGNGILSYDGDPETLTYLPPADFEYKDVFTNPIIKNLVMHIVTEDDFNAFVS